MTIKIWAWGERVRHPKGHEENEFSICVVKFAVEFYSRLGYNMKQKGAEQYAEY